MKVNELPPLCQTCKNKNNADSLGCSGYAFRVAWNDFKSAIRQPFDKLHNREPKEYDYSCLDYEPTEGIKKFYYGLGQLFSERYPDKEGKQ